MKSRFTKAIKERIMEERRSAVKRNTSTRRQAATSQVSRANVFTSEMER